MRLDPITLTAHTVEAGKPRCTVLRAEGRDRESDLPRKRSTLRIGLAAGVQRAPVMPDDHSEVVPLLPIPNRTVKRLSADDSAGSRVKVGHRQATI